MTPAAAIAHAAASRMHQHVEELTAFVPWLLSTLPQSRRLGCVIDIGAHHGGTSILWGELGAQQIISIDLPDGPWGGLTAAAARDRNVQLEVNYPGFVGILADSHSPITVAQVVGAIRHPVDLVFIDGDHSFLGVQADYQLYAPLVRTGGVVAFHDIADTEFHRDRGVDVARFWRTFDVTVRQEFVCGSHWGGIGAVRVW